MHRILRAVLRLNLFRMLTNLPKLLFARLRFRLQRCMRTRLLRRMLRVQRRVQERM